MPDIWQRSFLQADGDSLDDDSDGADAPTLDPGEMEKQALDALDLSTRDEGGLVVKHNPWTKAKVAAGSSAQSSSDASSSSSSSATVRKKAPPAPARTTSATDRPPHVSPPATQKLRPAAAPSRGTVQGRNGWWQPPPSAARPRQPSPPASWTSAARGKKRKDRPAQGEQVGENVEEQVIDLTSKGEKGPATTKTQDLVRRLKRRRSLNHRPSAPNARQAPVDPDGDEGAAEDSRADAPPGQRPKRDDADPASFEQESSSTETRHGRPDPRPPLLPTSAPKSPPLTPEIVSDDELAPYPPAISSSSSPSPKTKPSVGRIDGGRADPASSSGPSATTAIPLTQRSGGTKGQIRRPSSRAMQDDKADAHTPLPPAVQAGLATSAQRGSSSNRPPKAPDGARGSISFSKIPKDARPTADYPILQGLALQRSKAARAPSDTPSSPSSSRTVANAYPPPAQRQSTVARERHERTDVDDTEDAERPEGSLPAPALEYFLPPPVEADADYDQPTQRGRPVPLSRPATRPSFAPLRPSLHPTSRAPPSAPPLRSAAPAPTTAAAPSAYSHPALADPAPTLADRWSTLPPSRRSAVGRGGDSGSGSSGHSASSGARRVTLWRPTAPAPAPAPSGSSDASSGGSSDGDGGGGRGLRLVGPTGQGLLARRLDGGAGGGGGGRW